MTPSSLKTKLSEGKAVLGTWNIIPSPIIFEIFGCSGLDFAILDMEHGIFDVSALDSCIRACEASDIAPIVRIPRLNSFASQWALDLGAHGIISPQISTKSDSQALVNLSKYPPTGIRGYNPFTRAGSYSTCIETSNKLSDDFSLNCIIIEDKLGLENLSAIANTPGLDVIYIGAYDLSIALGFKGDTMHPSLINVIYGCISKILSFGKSVGLMVSSPEQIHNALRAGATFLVYGVDTFMLSQAASNAVRQLSNSQNQSL